MKIETTGLFDLIENAITSYEIKKSQIININCFELSIYIEDYIEKNYDKWSKIND